MADHAISEQGPDFVADHQVVESHLLPVRPQSRLGFNPTPGHPQAPAVTGSSSLAPDVGHTSSPTPTLTPTHSSSLSPSSPPLPAPLPHPAAVVPSTAHCDGVEKFDVGASTLSTCTETKNTFQSPNGNSETPRSHPGSPAPQSPTPRPTTPKSPTSPRSVSRLCFPFVTTRSKPKPNAVPPPRPPPRHKYSSFAHSPLSPFSNDRPALAHQRHKYHDHGRSRSGLEQVKDFWSTREHQWKGFTPSDDQVPALVKASSGQPFAPSRSAGRLGHETMPAAQEAITIHPRRGDIQALRDPFCVDMDICFSDLPLWTMSKVLWMSDLHKALALKNGTHRADEDPSDSESDYDTCTSATGFNSDSDATLVESESESDLPRLAAGKSAPALVGVGAKVEQFTDPEGGKCHLTTLNQRTIRGRQATARPSVLPITTSTATASVPDKKPDWPLAVYKHGRPGSSASSSLEYDSSWATNWYQRWDILTELSREHLDDRNISHTVNPIGRNWDPRSTFHHSPMNKGIPGRRFFISGGSSHHHYLKDPHDLWNHRFGSFRRTK